MSHSVGRWTSNDVHAWLLLNNFGDYAPIFVRQRFHGCKLVNLKESDLNLMEINDADRNVQTISIFIFKSELLFFENYSVTVCSYRTYFSFWTSFVMHPLRWVRPPELSPELPTRATPQCQCLSPPLLPVPTSYRPPLRPRLFVLLGKVPSFVFLHIPVL